MRTVELWKYTKMSSLWKKLCVTEFNNRNAAAQGVALAVSVTYFLCVIALSNIIENSNSPDCTNPIPLLPVNSSVMIIYSLKYAHNFSPQITFYLI